MKKKKKKPFINEVANIINDHIYNNGQGELKITTNTAPEKTLYVERVLREGVGVSAERIKIDHKTSIECYRITSVKTVDDIPLYSR